MRLASNQPPFLIQQKKPVNCHHIPTRHFDPAPLAEPLAGKRPPNAFPRHL
jgi:hypothetical protein